MSWPPSRRTASARARASSRLRRGRAVWLAVEVHRATPGQGGLVGLEKAVGAGGLTWGAALFFTWGHLAQKLPGCHVLAPVPEDGFRQGQGLLPAEEGRAAQQVVTDGVEGGHGEAPEGRTSRPGRRPGAPPSPRRPAG